MTSNGCRQKELTSDISSCREQKLPTVPETLLKRRKRIDEVRKARAFARRAAIKVRAKRERVVRNKEDPSYLSNAFKQ